MNGLLQNAGSGSEAMTPRRDGAGIKEPNAELHSRRAAVGDRRTQKRKRAPYPCDPKEAGRYVLFLNVALRLTHEEPD